MKSRALLLAGALLVSGALDASAEESEANASAPTGDEIRLFGRGVIGAGNDDKRREDYDALSSGGGVAGHASRRWEEGGYLDADGGLLILDRGADIDQAEVRIRGGRWGAFSLTGGLRLDQRFYELAPEEAVPFDPPTDGLDAQKQEATLAGELRFGEGGRVRIDYRHFDDEGERNRLKGSVLESLGPYSFRGSAFDDLDTRSDELRALVGFDLVGVDLELTGGWADERNRTRTVEVATANQFDDDVRLDRYHAGLNFATTALADMASVHGAYRFDRVDGESVAAQRDASGATVRESDDISVEETRHTGTVGLIASPIDHLVFRGAYLVRSTERDGSGDEIRDSAGGDSQVVSNRTRRDGLDHAPRVSLSYAGLPRTRLSAGYRFERARDDIDLRSLVDGEGPAEIDRIQDMEEDRYQHRVDVSARLRAARALVFDVGYRFHHEQIEDDVEELVNEVILGDRERERHVVRAGARWRVTTRTLVDLDGEYSNEDYERSDAGRGSSSNLESGAVTARVSTVVAEGLSLTGLVRYVNRDQDVGSRSDRELSIFRDIRFQGRSATGSVVASWMIDPETTLRAQYEIVDAGGSLDNLNHRLFTNASYRPRPDLSLGLGYGFVKFDDSLLEADDFDAHTLTAGVDLSF